MFAIAKNSVLVCIKWSAKENNFTWKVIIFVEVVLLHRALTVCSIVLINTHLAVSSFLWIHVLFCCFSIQILIHGEMLFEMLFQHLKEFSSLSLLLLIKTTIGMVYVLPPKILSLIHI